jgi:hypothetical protein
MLARIAATVLLSVILFIVVTLFVSLVLLWWSGDVIRSVLIGVICGCAAAVTVGAVNTAYGQSEEHSSDEHERSRDEQDR